MDILAINPDTFAQMQALLGDEFDDFLQVFADDTKNNIAGIAEAERTQDLEVRTRLAHTVKSSLATIGAESLAEVAFRIECAGDDVTIDEDLKTLQEGCVGLCQKLLS